MDITIYHNPRCSKSRATLELMRAHGVEPEIVEYLRTPPDESTLRALLAALDIAPIDLVRRGEDAWKNAQLAPDADDDAVIALMIEHPVLIERPIVRRGQRAVVGRPPENVLALLED